MSAGIDNWNRMSLRRKAGFILAFPLGLAFLVAMQISYWIHRM